ncbi:putative 2-oxoglutarate-and Fe(II)-dependent dioxygenase YbiX [Planctomycetales bacterium 10988]|nr:putative 2-oxoglutarate-and Fe(II)-dependent dioxygenase YbiX [Planctomycetales bacterium 10988]
MQKEVINGHRIFVIHDFFSPQECQEYIEFAESLGFHDAPINTLGGQIVRKDIRNNTRVMTDDPQRADDLWQKAKPWVIDPWQDRQALGLNERFRFYKYEPGQTFAPHYDGAFTRENGERSAFTFMIYLNDDFEGGATNFFQPEHYSVKPRAGSLLIFFHFQLHEGAVVEAGTKYVLRTDIMYEPEF